jgi:predicted ArsR family transcriptional regulator
MERSILELLEQHGSLGHEQVAAYLHDEPDAVRTALTAMRDRGLVNAVPVGELVGNRTNAAAYWRLTDAGRAELARSR